jgi:hypothetical protein
MHMRRVIFVTTRVLGKSIWRHQKPANFVLGSTDRHQSCLHIPRRHGIAWNGFWMRKAHWRPFGPVQKHPGTSAMFLRTLVRRSSSSLRFREMAETWTDASGNFSHEQSSTSFEAGSCWDLIVEGRKRGKIGGLHIPSHRSDRLVRF